MHYRGTIEIPNDENWIVQGALGSDGIPVTLDARLSSGTAVDPSQASVVVRYTRFSGKPRIIAGIWVFFQGCQQ